VSSHPVPGDVTHYYTTKGCLGILTAGQTHSVVMEDLARGPGFTRRS
jgi:hypothetical protein